MHPVSLSKGNPGKPGNLVEMAEESIILQVRCGMERPACARCRTDNALCVYPPIANDLTAFLLTFETRLGQASWTIEDLEVRWRNLYATVLSFLQQNSSQTSEALALAMRLSLPPQWRTEGGEGGGIQINTNVQRYGDMVRILEARRSGEHRRPLEVRSVAAHGETAPISAYLSTAFKQEYGPYSLRRPPPSLSLAQSSEMPLSHYLQHPMLPGWLDRLIEVYVDCFHLCHVPFRETFLDGYRGNKLDKLLVWAIWAWAAYHCSTSHLKSHGERDVLMGLGKKAFGYALDLLRERYDGPSSLAIVRTLLTLQSCTHFTQVDSCFLILAQKHLDLVPSPEFTCAPDIQTRIHVEERKRLQWAIAMIHQERVIRSHPPSTRIPDRYSVQVMPNLLEGEGEELGVCVWATVQIGKLRYILGEFVSRCHERSASPMQSHTGLNFEVILEFERRLKSWWQAIPRERGPNRSPYTCPHPHARQAICELEVYYATALVQLHLPFFFQITTFHWQSSSLHRSPPWPSSLEKHAENICTAGADFITERLISLLNGPGGFCRIASLFDSLNIVCKIYHRLAIFSPLSQAREHSIACLRRCHTTMLRYAEVVGGEAIELGEKIAAYLAESSGATSTT
ncbi:uncharacterized protein VTP21DRAFT_7263 [Calcarisporiella thermophila]|uniref:uncharacterized protein n=1 Tax=Calcarisporiella thermophila TaxID=911321 RepID=UPI0037439233